MAEKQAVVTRPDDDSMLAIWDVVAGDTCVPVTGMHEYSDRTAQVYGIFDGGSVSVKGTADGVEYDTLNDPFGTALSFSARGIKGLTEYAAAIQPVISGGSGSLSLRIAIRAKRTKG